MNKISRRSLLTAASGTAALAAISATADEPWRITNGRINQSVCSWCYKPVQIAELARAAAALGCKSVELLRPSDFPIVKDHGLICAMTSTHPLVKGLNHVENHAECLEVIRTAIDANAEVGFPNVITFSGNRAGISDEEGIRNMVKALKQIAGHAEKQKVNICIEVLNSRVGEENKGHPDYQCDRVEFAAAVIDGVGSDRVKILFDIYHVQIMQGDLLTRIRKFKDYIGHYHTAGVPGRNELDEDQELFYPAIMREIVATGFQGYVGQEFIPKADDKLAALAAGVRICDV